MGEIQQNAVLKFYPNVQPKPLNIENTYNYVYNRRGTRLALYFGFQKIQKGGRNFENK